MSEHIKYDYLKHFVDECVTPVCKDLFKKRFNDLKPDGCATDSWTVEKFLQINKNKILSTKEGREKEWVLFPNQPDRIDIGKWAPTVFCFILIEIGNLSKVLRINLQTLKEYIDDIEKYKEDKDESCFAEIKIIIGVCLDEIKSEQLSKTISDRTKNLERKKLTKKQNTSHSNKPKPILRKVGMTFDAKTESENGKELDVYNETLRKLLSKLPPMHVEIEEKGPEPIHEESSKIMEEKAEALRQHMEDLLMQKVEQLEQNSSSPLFKVN